VNASCLRHVLSDAEREQFTACGYIVVRDALAPVDVERLRVAAFERDRAYRRASGIGAHHVLNEHDLIVKDDVWLDLIDWPTTFPKVWTLLGWNIQLFHTQLIVTPPAPAGASPDAYGWHQDNNRMNRDLDEPRQPMISLKVGYFLSDVPEKGMGNLCVVPGSHRAGFDELCVGDGRPVGAEAITASAGDAVIFDRRLWHSASTNCSDVTRVFLTYGYSHRWLRPKSAMRHEHLYERVDPIRRQLLGQATSANGYYDPLPEDVPLREWIRSELGDVAVRP
jgi:ectoine hydroxylase